MAFEINTLLSCKFSAKVKSTGSTVKDDAQPKKEKDIIFTQTEADKIFSEYLNSPNTSYTNQLHSKTNPNGERFLFNYYKPGSYYDGSAEINMSAELPIQRNFNTKSFRDFLKNNESFIQLVKGKNGFEKQNINDTFVNNIKTNTIQSKKKISFSLDYNIPKKGWATDDAGRTRNKETIKNKIGFSQTTNVGDFKRIVKIMAFILARERGTLAVGTNGKSSEELMQREYGLICWSIINTCDSGFQGTKGNLLNVLKNVNFVNTDNYVGQNDADKDTDIKQKYNSNNDSTQNLEYFVLAFFAGWINEEYQGVTNWSHINGLSVYSSFHLPKNPSFVDPDINDSIEIDLTYYDSKSKSDVSLGKLNVKLTESNSIPQTSLDSTKTLDGNVIFTRNV